MRSLAHSRTCLPPGTCESVSTFLRPAAEMVMVHRGETDGVVAGLEAGAAFSHELAGVLHKKVRVRPTSYHSGICIGRDCSTIGDSSALVCSALVGK